MGAKPGVSSKLLEKYGFTEELRIEGAQENYYHTTGYPAPEKTYKLVFESTENPIEQWYYWVLDYLRYDYSFNDIDKIVDVFTAAENSSFFGVSQQRLGIQQDKVSQYLATIGKMVKELFQLVRELRIIDERLRFYYDSMSNSKSSESAEIALKGIWVDMVEQGSKNPGSVYGLARELGFGTLPDLFFSIHPKTAEDVDAMVDALEKSFNRKVREVLKRKLRTYIEWRNSTFEELKTKRKFTIKYLRHHFDVIKMYMNWVKPYLRHIQRLSMDQEKLDAPDLVNAFETSMIEIELLFKRRANPHGTRTACVLITFDYRTRPAMAYQQEGYNRGPSHTGKLEMSIRGYVWSDKQIANYKKMRAEEDLALLNVIDGSVAAAMEALGDELMNYLKEAGEEFGEPVKVEKVPHKGQSAIAPFTEVITGFGELFGALVSGGSGKKEKENEEQVYWDKKEAKDLMVKAVWDTYKNFKKNYGMLAW